MDNKTADLKRVRYLATQLYMLFLKEKSGGLSFGSIEKHFKKTSLQTKQEYWDNHTGAFYKYARGSTKIKDQKLIDRIEESEQYQGGKYILNHPLWLILENPSATLDNVHEYMRLLPPNIQTRLFKLNKSSNQFERNYWNKSEHLSRISMLNNLDALACCVIT